jgi:hypothetical protein
MVSVSPKGNVDVPNQHTYLSSQITKIRIYTTTQYAFLHKMKLLFDVEMLCTHQIQTQAKAMGEQSYMPMLVR